MLSRWSRLLAANSSPTSFFRRTLATSFETGKAEVHGAKLYWEKHGSGPKTVLFLPGLVGSVQSNYRPVFKKMDPTKFTMIGIDPIGYGKSRPPDRNPFTEEFILKTDAIRAAEVMQSLGYEKYSVVGWSNGGITAGFVANLHPKNVERLLFCNAPLKASPERTVIVMDQIMDLKNWDRKNRKELLRIYEEDYAVKLLKDWRYFTKRELEKPVHFANSLLSIYDRENNVPLMFIYGSQDAFMHPLEAVMVFEECATTNTRLHLVRGGSHFHLDFLDEFVEVASDFLSEGSPE